MRLELTREGLPIKLADHCTNIALAVKTDQDEDRMRLKSVAIILRYSIAT